MSRPANSRSGLFWTLLLCLIVCPCAGDQASPIPSEYSAKAGQQMPADWRSMESAGFTIINPADGAELCWIPPGEFLMGSTSHEQQWALANKAQLPWVKTENPQHVVKISGFWLYKYEVTNEQFSRLRPNRSVAAYDDEKLDGDRQPAVYVDWNDAAEYSRWARGRLPTEAQWEYACRAGSTTMFWWGDDPSVAAKYANVADCTAKAKWPQWSCVDVDDGYVISAPVGSYLPNRFGLFDMLGNVWEWCADWFDAKYYASSPLQDPSGPNSGTQRIVRGAAWDNWLGNCRSAYRLHYAPDKRLAYMGFRVACPPAVPIEP